MARTKAGGFVGNLSKLGGSGKKLSLKGDMTSNSGNMTTPSLKKAGKQAHKKV